MKEKRILIIGNFLSDALGTYGVCELLAKRLGKNGWLVVTASTHVSRFYRLLDMLFTAWKTHNKYSVATVDVFSGASFIWAFTVCLLLKWLRKPYVLVLHGGNLPNFSADWPKATRWLLQGANCVISPSYYIASALSWARSGIAVISNAIEINEYKYRHRNEVRPHIIWLRAFHNIYNPALAADTIAMLMPLYSETTLRMLGPDKEDGSLQVFQQHVQTLNIGHHVILEGAIPKSRVPEYLDSADIFLNTTNIDNTPVSIIEAMACGLCIVSTNVGGIPYLLDHEHDALLVPPNDPKAMADAVRRILTEPGLAERLSRNARAKAEQFDWSNILPQWETLLIEVIKRH